MKLVYTDEALADLDEIFRFISEQYPGAFFPAFKSGCGSLPRASPLGPRARHGCITIPSSAR